MIGLLTSFDSSVWVLDIKVIYLKIILLWHGLPQTSMSCLWALELIDIPKLDLIVMHSLACTQNKITWWVVIQAIQNHLLLMLVIYPLILDVNLACYTLVAERLGRRTLRISQRLRVGYHGAVEWTWDVDSFTPNVRLTLVFISSIYQL